MPRLRPSRSSSGSSADADVKVSEELFAPVSRGVELCYQTFGDADDEPLLLVMGLGGPMTWWDEGLCRLLASRGFFVIRYDNRDTGRSSRMHGKVTRPMLVRAFVGLPVRPPYTLADMADDAFGLLDHLGLESAHVTGVSMGGMIAQTMAVAQPARVRSLVSMMSTTGRRTVGWQHPSLLPALLKPGKHSREEAAARSALMSKLIGSPDYPEEHERALQRGRDTFDRGYNPSGVLRHMMAVLTQPDRGKPLHSLRIPATVIHGMADKMVHPSGGRATARAIPGAQLLLIPGMGHDLPEPLWETFADAIRRTADRAAG
jgi:pimeloyl-ACP methyl ester carboxylesterase